MLQRCFSSDDVDLLVELDSDPDGRPAVHPHPF
jgi:hypothetical protein